MKARSRFLACLMALACMSGCHPGSGAFQADASSRSSRPVRVLILGDSISMGYTPVVRKNLGESAVVFRPMKDGENRAENCEGTTRGVEAIDRWLAIDGGEFDVIHFNFGLHDLKRINPDTGRSSADPDHPRQADLDRYREQLATIVDALQASGARLIFATTTPVPEGGVRPHRDPEDVLRYNQAAIELMTSQGIVVNDLYAFVLPRLSELQKPVNVHFTREGTKALAEQVAAAIRPVAGLQPAE
ncbi:MAG: SGNH/GDSL hydrolase family protein [Phycisphaerales bacterium]|nr:SGNH/GDSL hydrolase family protein [Phycisphaerales bacterium]